MTIEQTVEAVVEAVEQAVEDAKADIAEVIEDAVVGRAWQGKYARLDLDAITQNTTASVAERLTDTGSGVKLSEKDALAIAQGEGVTKADFAKVDGFRERLALAVHAASTERNMERMKNDSEVTSASVKASLVGNVSYEDTIHRHKVLSVPAGAGSKERVEKEVYGYHNPSIKTRYPAFEKQRQAVHALAKDLFS